MTRRLLLFGLLFLLVVSPAFATDLNYWIEPDSTGAPTRVWVKVPYIPANGSVTIYARAEAGFSPSDPANIFVFYDDFTTNQGWTLSGCTITGGNLYFPNDGVYNGYAQITLPESLDYNGTIGYYIEYEEYSDGTGGYNYYALWLNLIDSDLNMRRYGWLPGGANPSYGWYIDSAWTGIDYNITAITGYNYYLRAHVYLEQNQSTLYVEYGGTSTWGSPKFIATEPTYTIKTITAVKFNQPWDLEGSVFYILISKYAPGLSVSVTYSQSNDYYIITISNPNSTDLTDFQVSIPASDLNVTSTTESLHFSDQPFFNLAVSVVHTPAATQDLALDPENNITSITVDYNATFSKQDVNVTYWRAYDGDSNATLVDGNTDVNYITFSRTYTAVGDYNTCVFVKGVDSTGNEYNATACDVVHVDEYPQHLSITHKAPLIDSSNAVEVNFEANAWDNGTLTYSWTLPANGESETFKSTTAANTNTTNFLEFNVTDAQDRYLIPNQLAFSFIGKGDPVNIDVNIYDTTGNLCYTGRLYVPTTTTSTLYLLPLSSFKLLCATPPKGFERVVAQISGASFYGNALAAITEGNISVEGNVSGEYFLSFTATTALVTGQTVLVIFPGTGTYHISVTATDNIGLSKTKSIDYNIGSAVISLQDSVTGLALTKYIVHDFNTGDDFNDGGTGKIYMWYPIVPKGWHKIGVIKAGYLDTNYWIYIPPNETNSITLKIHPVTAIVVTLTDEDTGATISSFRVVVTGPHDFEANTTTGTIVIHPDADLNLQYGEYQITVYPEDSNYPSNEYRNYYVNITRDWILSHGANFDLKAYAVKTANVVWQTIQVLDSSGVAVQGAKITISRSIGGVIVPVAQGITNYQGEITVPLSNLQQYYAEISYTAPNGTVFKLTQTFPAGVQLVAIALKPQPAQYIPPDVIVQTCPIWGFLIIQPPDINDPSAYQKLANIVLYSTKGSFIYIKYHAEIVDNNGDVLLEESNAWTGYPTGVSILFELNNAVLSRLFPEYHVPTAPPTYLVKITITYDHTELGERTVTVEYTLTTGSSMSFEETLKQFVNEFGTFGAWVLALLVILSATVALIATGRPIAFMITLIFWDIMLMYAGWLPLLWGFILILFGFLIIALAGGV